MNTKKALFFTENLLRWNKDLNKRAMPWKAEKDPYKIWLSEIILQQTRVAQGLDYYNRYIKKFPTIKQLAAAEETTIFKLWEGLGYYTRCRNLIATAKFIAGKLNGKFPHTYEDILKLKGVGPYTAAAIASFAYNLPYAVLDGNVMRVLSRYAGIDMAIDSTEGKKYFASLATTLLAKGQSAIYNQAIMDFGATVCKPQLPLCAGCCLKMNCSALKENKVEQYPVKGNRLIKKQRWFYYVVASYKGAYYIRKRTSKDIWQNLHEFILLEKDKELKILSLLADQSFTTIAGKNHSLTGISKMYKQQLTHQTIYGCFIHIELKEKIGIAGYELVRKGNIKELAFPRFITRYFEETGIAP
jgi:A/G-specific adenine glycosylase